MTIDLRVSNARRVRAAAQATARAMIVTGDEASRRHWQAAFAAAAEADGRSAPTVVAERGRKGNFLGALQAYRRSMQLEFGATGPGAFDQLVMIVGSGTRLSPITQSLRNMKAALLLPSNDGERATMTVGEAAVRSSAPWISMLGEGGFQGVVMRWGDEILIPSADLSAEAGAYADADVVRFGYIARPTELLAEQKEWLLCDEEDNVYAELPRQALHRLLDRASEFRSAKTLHVNLGSFAASHRFLESFCEEFSDLLDDEEVGANWDPYLWIACHSATRAEWEDACRAGREIPRDFADLVSAIPDFWQRVQRAKNRLTAVTGRPFSSKVVDFGEPYWFDAGNHASLRNALGEIFAPSKDGDTVRALLGLPDSLATGQNFVRGSRIAEGTEIRNSLVVGTTIADPGSLAERAILINSTLGNVRIDPGGVVIECDCRQIEVDGPSGFAFRLSGRAHVGGDEITASIGDPPNDTRLSHFGVNTVISGEDYGTRRWANPISFKDAAALAETFDVAETDWAQSATGQTY
ncbi:hypothetical protein [Promicromonospora soli]